MKKIVKTFIFMLLAMCTFEMTPEATTRAYANQKPWRIRFLEAAVVKGPLVLLGEVAVPIGELSDDQWNEMAKRELWPSPAEDGKSVSMSRARLQEAVVATMKDLSPYCLFPGSVALRRGGAVLGKDEVQKLVVKELTPLLGNMPGEASFRDFRIPQYIFLKHENQKIALEPQKRIEAGRINFKIIVSELDGAVVQRMSGSAFMDVWVQAPTTTSLLNKDDLLEPDKITHTRVNLATLRDTPWDGRGGPWRVVRPLGLQQVIYQSDVGHIPTVRKGTVVTLVYASKSMRLSIKAEALADGTVGESIPVRNVQSKREVYAVVENAESVFIRRSM